MQTRNITLSLPEVTLREVKVLAAMRGTAVSALLSETLTDILASEHGYAAARERSLVALGRGRDLGTNGEISWDRDELHERASISFWDAMILTSASALGCGVLYSEDLTSGQSYDGVRVVNLIEGGAEA